MSKEDSLGSLFGKAKKWAQQELKNAVSVGGDPVKNKQEREANEQLGDEIQLDAEQIRDDAIISALTPQSLKDYQAYNAANRAEREAQQATEARADREARAGASSVELSGFVTGRAEGLAVEKWLTEGGADLCVNVECVEPVGMSGGTVSGFCFAIPGFHGDGTYALLDSIDFNSLQFELYLTGESDGWAFHPSFGPGNITVADGVADVQLVLGSSGNDTIQLHGTVIVGDGR